MKRYDEPKVISGPSIEPVSLDEVKQSARVYNSQEDNLLQTYIGAARRILARETGRTFIDTTLEFSFDFWARLPYCAHYIELPRATPLIEIISVTLKDSGGNTSTWDASEYIADTRTFPGRLVLAYNKSWPSFTPYPVDPIVVQYRAGEAAVYPADVVAPPDVKELMLLFVGAMYVNRESEFYPDKLANQIIQQPLFSRMIENLKVIHDYSDYQMAPIHWPRTI